MNEYTFLCPIRHRPIAGTLRLMHGSLSVKCKFCGEIHIISRAELEQRWSEIEQEKGTGSLTMTAK